MATLASSGLSQNYLKLRWTEPYVSESTNIQNTANSPGVYRGGHVSETSPSPSQSFIVTKGSDVDSFFIVTNSSNGTTLAVRFESDITIDMSSRFTGGGGSMPGDETWYVWIEVSYAATSTTTGNVIVSDTAPTGDEVMLAIIDMLNGDTTIQDARIRTDGSAKTLPLRRKALVLSKKENITSLSSATYFQASGKVYVGNETVNAKKFTWLAQSGSVDPLVGSDDRLIDVEGLYKDSGLTQPVGSSDVDEDGFYDSPYVKLDVSRTGDSNYTGDLDFWFYGYYNLEDIPTDDDNAVLKFLYTHADVVQSAGVTGSPNSIISTDLQSVLSEVLPLLNSRFKHQASVPPTFDTLLWRNHDVDNSGVNEQTISIYYQEEELTILRGGYLSGNNIVVNNIPALTKLYQIWLSENYGFVIAFKEIDPSTPLVFDRRIISNFVSWFSAKDDNIQGRFLIDGTDPQLVMDKNNAHIYPGFGGTFHDTWHSFIASKYKTGLINWTNYGCAIWVGENESPSSQRYGIGTNLTWDEDDDAWKPTEDLTDSFFFEVARGGIFLYRMDKDDPNHNTTTGWTHAQWTSKMALVDVPSDVSPSGDEAYANGYLEGDWLEQFAIAFSWENRTGSSTDYNAHNAYSYRHKYQSAPTSFTEYEDTEGGASAATFTATAYSNATAQELGFYIDVDFTTVADNAMAYIHGRVDVYS